MDMFNNMLRTLPFGRRPAPRPYSKMGGGLLLPALAYFGWKYRDQIRSFVREKMDAYKRTSTAPAPSNGPTTF